MRPVLLIAAVAVVVAFASNVALQAVLAVDAEDAVGAVRADDAVPLNGTASAQTAGEDVDTYRQVILERNLFDSRTPGVRSTREVPVGTQVDGVTVVGTFVTQPASLSSALVRVDGSEDTQFLGLGDRLGDDRVAAISSMSVHLEPFTD